MEINDHLYFDQDSVTLKDQKTISEYSKNLLEKLVDEYYSSMDNLIKSLGYREAMGMILNESINPENVYEYWLEIDCDKEFLATIRNHKDEIIYKIESFPNGDIYEIKAGYIKNVTNTKEIEKFLIDNGTISENSLIKEDIQYK